MEIRYKRKEYSLNSCATKRDRLQSFTLPKGLKILEWENDPLCLDLDYFGIKIKVQSRESERSSSLYVESQFEVQNKALDIYKYLSGNYKNKIDSCILCALKYIKTGVFDYLDRAVKNYYTQVDYNGWRHSLGKLKISSLRSDIDDYYYQHYVSPAFSLWSKKGSVAFCLDYSFSGKYFTIHSKDSSDSSLGWPPLKSKNLKKALESFTSKVITTEFVSTHPFTDPKIPW